jgi:hypothetical protein
MAGNRLNKTLDRLFADAASAGINMVFIDEYDGGTEMGDNRCPKHGRLVDAFHRCVPCLHEEIAALKKNRCDTCGARVSYYPQGCPTCGAPQCCRQCCTIYALKNQNDTLLDAAQWAYRKHHLNDDTMGWDELGNLLCNVLCDVMGDDGFVNWKEAIK